jgi:integrase
VLQAYQASEDFTGLAASTRRSYVALITRIEKAFAISQADYAWTVLARVLSWGLDRGLVAGGRLYRGSRAEKIWTHADEAAFLERAPVHLHLPLLLALWTGQRQGDLLRLPWSAYDGKHIRLRQSKGGKPVMILVGAPLKAALDSALKRSPIMLTNSDGKPWTSDGFRASWRKACAAAQAGDTACRHRRHTAPSRGRSAHAKGASIHPSRDRSSFRQAGFAASLRLLTLDQPDRCRCVRVLDLDPIRRSPGPIGRVAPLRHDTLEAAPAAA